MRLGVAAAIVRGELLRGDVELDEARIAGVGLEGSGTGVAVPGFVDLQVNGYAGVDLLNEPERWREVDLMLAGIGVTTWQPTLVPAPLDLTLRALEVIGELRAGGAVASLGHSAADAASAHAAFDAGASTVTHLFNVMRPFGHRDPGLAGTALARDDVLVQVICDGVHLADETVLLAWRAAHGRLAVGSDATAAAGRNDGSFQLGEIEVKVEGGVA